jgi:hypothetical protein
MNQPLERLERLSCHPSFKPVRRGDAGGSALESCEADGRVGAGAVTPVTPFNGGAWLAYAARTGSLRPALVSWRVTTA